jgi:hypothetical protein
MKQLWILLVASAAAAIIAVAPTEARAQATNITTFQCASGGGAAVDIVASGLGNRDLCVISTLEETVSCACVGGGNNCPSDTKKQDTTETTVGATEVEAKNGSVRTTVTPDFADPSCGDLTCPSGQTATLIQTSALADFRVCSLAPGETCDTTTCPADEALATANDCGPDTTTFFRGKRDSCVNLFP